MKKIEKDKVDLAKIFRKGGYNLPLDESEVESFEKNLEKEEKIEPNDWENPLDILRRGKVKKVQLQDSEIENDTVQNLSYAARDGKKIPDTIRKKMDEDRKKSKE